MTARILIADDNEVARGYLHELLTNREGWEVCAAVDNGRKAVEKAAELKPGLIILDLAMPEMDGLTAAREIGKILPSTPIVMFTLHKLSVLELEAKKAGVREVVGKPDTDTLLKVVEELLKAIPQDTLQEKTGLLASAAGPLDPVSPVTAQPQFNEAQAAAGSDPDTSIEFN